jgi:hypothetical protein
MSDNKITTTISCYLTLNICSYNTTAISCYLTLNICSYNTTTISCYLTLNICSYNTTTIACYKPCVEVEDTLESISNQSRYIKHVHVFIDTSVARYCCSIITTNI